MNYMQEGNTSHISFTNIVSHQIYICKYNVVAVTMHYTWCDQDTVQCRCIVQCIVQCSNLVEFNTNTNA